MFVYYCNTIKINKGPPIQRCYLEPDSKYKSGIEEDIRGERVPKQRSDARWEKSTPVSFSPPWLAASPPTLKGTKMTPGRDTEAGVRNEEEDAATTRRDHGTRKDREGHEDKGHNRCAIQKEMKEMKNKTKQKTGKWWKQMNRKEWVDIYHDTEGIERKKKKQEGEENK